MDKHILKTVNRLVHRIKVFPNMLGKFTVHFHEEQIEKTISVILRVPGLFLLNLWLQTSDSWTKSLDPDDYLRPLLSPFILIQSLLVQLLPLENVVNLYMHYLSVALIASAELYSRHYISAELQQQAALTGPHHFIAILIHVLVATSVSFLLDVECNMKKAVLAVYTVPVAVRLASFPLQYLEILHNIATVVTILSVVYYLIGCLPAMLLNLRRIHTVMMHGLHQHGLVHSLILLWHRLFVMPQLLVFWCALLVTRLYTYLFHQEVVPMMPSNRSEWYLLLLYAVSDVCTSPVSLAACCVAVSYISWTILSITKATAQGNGGLLDDHELERAGIGEGVTMALLALQTGLVDLPMPQRMGAMSIILFIVIGSLVQSMHEIVEPILLALGASHSCSILRHFRILMINLFLVIFPLYMTVFLCRLFDVDFWTIVVVSTCALTSVQVLGSLTVYCLFLYDAAQKDSGWEMLDDVVYFARAVTRILEFVVAVLVVGAGVRESMLLSSEGRPWSWLNCTVLAIHCYYNVYLRLHSGWQSFLLRREAVRKIHSLPWATAEQLQSRAHDVCAICYMEMNNARITPCLHMFHSACLKKWLYVQDRCPLCSAQIMFPSNSCSDNVTDAYSVVQNSSNNN